MGFDINNIQAGLTQATSNASASGDEQHIITDAEVASFGISDGPLKDAVGKNFGQNPNNAYLQGETPWGDLHKSHGCPQLQQRAPMPQVDQTVPTQDDGRILKIRNGQKTITKTQSIRQLPNSSDQATEVNCPCETSTHFDSELIIDSYRKFITTASVDENLGITSGVFFDKASADFAASYTSEVIEQYKISGKISSTEDRKTTIDTTFTIPPNDTLTLYNVSVAADGYNSSYVTNVNPGDVSTCDLKYTIYIDLSPVLSAFLGVILDNSNWETTDAEEWRQLYNNVIDSKDLTPPIQCLNSFVDLCATNLWTDGLDRASWSAVKEGMIAAQSINDPYLKLNTMFTSFINVNTPSHNSDAWQNIRASALEYVQY